MSDYPLRPSGHPPRRAPAAARVSDIVKFIRKAILRRRARIALRFRQPRDWTRLVALGILLIDLAVLSFANNFSGRRLEGYWPGTAAIFGGLLIGIIIIRITRPDLYFGWIAVGITETVLGLSLVQDPLLQSASTFVAFFICLAALGLLRVWIGMTCQPGNGAASLIAGGGASLFCAGWAAFDRATMRAVPPDIILATDLLLMGISIIAFGLSLRKAS